MSETNLRRRVVYMDDGQWEGLRREARSAGMSMSAYVRAQLSGDLGFGENRRVKVTSRTLTARA
jgi:hypothetical protein